VTVGDYSVFGGRAGVTDHVTIGERARVGLCSVVTKSVEPGDTVWGFPARPVRSVKEQLATLARMPKILKRFADVVARMTRLEQEVDRLQTQLRNKASDASP
jgi:UDP-3-O-[3-hydroxymyristoyl] glucosamine N-acyltransferase